MFEKVDRGSFKNSPNFSAPLILGDLENLDEGFLVNVSKPNLVAVCEDWNDNGKEDFTPAQELETPDRITYYLERADSASRPCRHDFNVGGPVERGGEEDS